MVSFDRIAEIHIFLILKFMYNRLFTLIFNFTDTIPCRGRRGEVALPNKWRTALRHSCYCQNENWAVQEDKIWEEDEGRKNKREKNG